MRRLPCMLAVVILVAFSASAVVPPSGDSIHKSRPEWVQAPELGANPSLDRVEHGNPRAGDFPGMAKFLAETPSAWNVTWDTRSNRAHIIQGPGVEFFTTKANSRKLDDVANAARAFMAGNPDLFGVDQADLAFDEEQSGTFGKDGHFTVVTFQQTYEGIPVEGAIAFFRLNDGKLRSFGTERIADIHMNTRANVDRGEALQRVLDHAGFASSEVTELLVDGELKIVPTLPPGESAGHAYAGAPGLGYRHTLAREVSFRREGDDATYEALVDAKSGRVLKLIDANDYATVTGGVVWNYGANDGPVITFPSNVATSGTCTSFDGVNVRMNDNCGSINICDSNDANTGNGQVDAGQSPGHDCSTPGFGGAGNTRSSRTGMYHLTAVRNIASGYHPTNAWLNGKLTSNMNINNTCNAYWSGSTVNFYRSGGGCGNTGEIPEVFVHEWGHGFDTNTGGAASDRASGEAVGDVFAALYMDNSCIGPGFQGSTCYNCVSCTGVRDIYDFGVNGSKPRATPANVTNNSGINCDRYSCPYGGYAGVMGYQGHCESIIASSALWNLRQDIGVAATEALWYPTMVPSKSYAQIQSGGQCNPSATVNGCGATNWYSVLIDVDDGTYKCNIWDALNAQGIACGSRPTGCGGGGPVCGNNVKETGETCDGTDLGGATCSSQGYCGGTLSCNASCSGFVTSSCTPCGGNELENGVPVTGLSATTGNQLDYTMDVPAGSTNLVFTTVGSDPDADLYVKFGSPPTTSSFDCRSWSSSSNETCNIGTAQGGTYYVMVYAYSTFTGLTLEGNYTPPGQSCDYYDSLGGLSGSTGAWDYYNQDVASCATTLTIRISGGSGDADLYVRRNANPTTTSYDCRPYLWGNNESCTFPGDGPLDTSAIYHIGIRAYSSYSGVLLEAEYH